MNVEWDTPDKNGTTRREHARQAGAEAPVQELPAAAEHLWELFWHLEAAQCEGPADVEAWCRLMGAGIEPWEYDVVVKMGLERRALLARRDRGRPGGA